MTTTDDQPNALVVRRLLPVLRERVFAAWLDPASLARWMRPEDVVSGVVEVDPRVGGTFRIVMTHGQRHDEHWGEYQAIEPPQRLSFTWLSANTDLVPTNVTVEFLERGDGTELILTHSRVPPAKVDSYRTGWAEIIRKLEDTLTTDDEVN